MNRKRAIYSMFLLGGGVLAGFAGYEWYSISKTPDLLFLDDNKALIADLTDTIIPRTNTAGAKDVLAHEAVIALLKNVADTKTQNNFIDGLKNVQEYSIKKYSAKFTALSKAEQVKVVTHFYEEGKNFAGNLGKARNKILGKSFFNILKSYTTIAYCTSKRGASEALAYDYIPGKFIACEPLASNQKSWATK